jgi:2-keto-3-deoxy-L-fuconate dehydrogenase
MRYTNKKVLVTTSNRYMGPDIAARFEEEGAEVIRSDNRLLDQQSVDELVASVGEIDILVANFAEPPRTASVEKISDEDWFILFDTLVHPLMRTVRGFAGGMKERKSGKIIAVTSAAPLRGIPNAAGYCSARGAQNAFVRAVGLELAKSNVQFNAIAQNYISNDTYYPDDFVANEKFKVHLKDFVPTKKVADGVETAELALYLASDRCTHLVGQVIPFAGGWTTTTG